jgi:hypothetical protein
VNPRGGDTSVGGRPGVDGRRGGNGINNGGPSGRRAGNGVGATGPNGRRVGNGVGNGTGRGAAGVRPGNRGTRVANPGRNRAPRNGNVVGYAARRPTLRSRPIVINNNYGNGGRRGGGRYTTYRGRHGYSRNHIYGSYFYFPGYSTFSVGIGYGANYRYAPYWHGSYGQAYGYDAYGYQSSYRNDYYTGSLRLKVQPRFGEVFVDGYYVGLVNDYDGVFQRLRLEEGPHHIEITEAGFVPLEFDVLILPGETITYEGYLTAL